MVNKASQRIAGHGYTRSQAAEGSVGILQRPAAHAMDKSIDEVAQDASNVLSSQHQLDAQKPASLLKQNDAPSRVDLQGVIKFESDREYLARYIRANFRDSEMLDYERETKDVIDVAQMSNKDIDRQFAQDSQRAWRFLSQNVIFRDAKSHLNKH